MSARLTAIRQNWLALPVRARSFALHAASLAIGIFSAVVLHYVLYRIGLPLKPFIYVAF